MQLDANSLRTLQIDAKTRPVKLKIFQLAHSLLHKCAANFYVNSCSNDSNVKGVAPTLLFCAPESNLATFDLCLIQSDSSHQPHF